MRREKNEANICCDGMWCGMVLSYLPDTFLCYQVVPVLHQRFGQSDGFAALDYGQELVGQALDSPFVHLFPYANDHVAVVPVESIRSTANNNNNKNKIEFKQFSDFCGGMNESE